MKICMKRQCPPLIYFRGQFDFFVAGLTCFPEKIIIIIIIIIIICTAI